jgi:4'-phosphopantetheinyl transferase EntD
VGVGPTRSDGTLHHVTSLTPSVSFNIDWQDRRSADAVAAEAPIDARAGPLHPARALPSCASATWERVLFSAKESVYEAWFPLARRWLDFDDVQVSLDPSTGTFRAVFLEPELTYAGRFVVRGGRIATAVEIGRR